MPCPYFEPRHVVEQPTLLNARLPLIEEYDGVCCARTEPFAVDAAARLRFCNHGNVRGGCEHFPEEEPRSSVRYEVLRRSAAHLDVLLIEEAAYAPLRWLRYEFRIDSEQLEPMPEERCLRGQLTAFCRSYIRRYPMETEITFAHVTSANR